MSKIWIKISVLLLCSIVTTVYAKDGWQDRPHVCDMPAGPRLEKCQNWISTVQRPDYRGASCCGDGDAFIADNFELGPNGELFAIITGDYPALPGYVQDDGTIAPPVFSIHKGQKILIPPEKVHRDPIDAGNTSGHGVVFIMISKGEVLCYDFPPLI